MSLRDSIRKLDRARAVVGGSQLPGCRAVTTSGSVRSLHLSCWFAGPVNHKHKSLPTAAWWASGLQKPINADADGIDIRIRSICS